MQIQASKRGQALYVKLVGELDHHSAPIFARQVDRMLEHPAVRVLELDLKQLTFMDSSGIGVLMGRYKKINARGGRMFVTNESRTIGKVMKLAGLYQIIEQIG